MFFKKKNVRCDNCNSKVNEKFSFCPYCGINLIDEEKYTRDYGLLGKNEEIDEEIVPSQFEFGFTDKLIGSLMNNLIKGLDKQFKNIGKEFDGAEIKSLPNGIRIQVGPYARAKKAPEKNQRSIFEKSISEKQLDRMNSLPREKAETKIKRLSDKIIYELKTPGIESPQDVFISKLESGYEIKAIGDKKVYVNSLPVNLPLKSLSINNDKLLVEFKTFEQ